MEKDQSHLTKKILNLTLEILYLLTGEEYGPIKRKTRDQATSTSHSHVSETWRRSAIMEPPLPSLTPEKNGKKILEISSKIVELLTKELPMGCQDVAVHLSMEEREYLEGHCDRYKVAMMKEDPLLKSLGGGHEKNLSKMRDLCPSDIKQIKMEDILQKHPDESLNIIVVDKVSNMDAGGDEDSLCVVTVKEEDIPVDIGSDYDMTYDISQNSLEAFDHGDFPLDDQAEFSPEDPSSQRQIFCPECGKTFTRVSHYTIHKRIHSGEKPYACTECGKSFSCNSYLVKHQRSHTGERPYCCTECGKQFNQSSNLFKHQKTHTGQKPFVCALCGKSFVQKSHLVIHQIVHTGEKRFPCNECGKSFSNNARLVAHVRVHTGEKPFGCPLCDKRFTQKSHLVKHNIVHTGEKPFNCDQCGKSFISNSHLVIHQRIHSGEKPYSCPVCDKKFTQKSDLVRHEKTHGGERPFPCAICGKRFLCRAYLIQHEKIHMDKPW